MKPSLFIKKADPVGNGKQEPATKARLKKMYERPPSFTNLLPWLEYDPGSKAFLLDDGFSVAALFEVTPIPSESRPENFLTELRDKVQLAIADTVPEESPHPWIIQFFLQDESHLSRLADDIEAYADERARGTRLTRTWIDLLRAHFRDIAKPGGLFVDEAVTGGPWRGRMRKVRVALYRRRSSTPMYRQGPLRLDVPLVQSGSG